MSLQKLLFLLFFILLGLFFQLFTVNLHLLLLLSLLLLKDCSVGYWVVLTILTSLLWWVHWLCILMCNANHLVLCSTAALLLWPFNRWSILLLEFSYLIIMSVFQRVLNISGVLILWTIKSLISIFIILNGVDIIFELVQLISRAPVWLLWH